jgi:hypothetical protein
MLIARDVKRKKQDSSGVAPMKNTDDLLYSDTQTKVEILDHQFHAVYTKENTSNIPDLNIHKATGPDQIPTRFLHDFADELAPTLTSIFQKALDTGEIPYDWREASTVPLYKKDDRHNAANSRAVFLTSASCKILEHVIHSQVMDHYDRLGIPTDKQHGFRSRRSCETQVIITIDSIAKSLANGEQVDVILLDFS